MSESSLRRSMIGAPPSASKGFFKANPPKREEKFINNQDNDTESIKSVKSNETIEDEQLQSWPEASNAETQKFENEIANDEPIKKKRRKRRIRLTDHTPKTKKREKKIFEKKETNDMKEKENAEPLIKKEIEEVVYKKPGFDTYTSFQLLCDYILRKLISKDPEEYFVHPVSPSIAPDYALIIKEPMDFMKIRKKIEQNEYKKFNDFCYDINLIWENAMTYNPSNTVYYLAAQKLSVLTKYYFSQQYLEYLQYIVPFGKDISFSQFGISLPNKHQDQNKCNDVNTKQNIVLDDLSVKDIIESTEASLKNRLAGRLPCGIGYLDNRDGALALNILVGPTNERPSLTLGDVVKPLDKGNPGMLNLVEPRLCLDYPISYTDPGPYASFAPQFDSTWATLNKHDSELLFSCYGDYQNATDALTLKEFVTNCDESFIKHVDNLLDSLTDGEHSKTIKVLENGTKKNDNEEKTEKNISSKSVLTDILDDVESLQNIGLQMSFIKDIKSDLGIKDSNSPEKLLKKTGTMINDLASLNYARLSAVPQSTLTDALGPTSLETQLADAVVAELQQEIKIMNVKPSNIVSAKGIHNSLGINDDDIDYDVLREFFSFNSDSQSLI